MRIKNLQITEEDIMKAAWDLLDQKGMEEFSMRKLADLLNIQAASLYWHFKSKQSIFQALANEVAKQCLLADISHEDWKDRLSGFASHMREVLHNYPCSAQLLMRTLPSEPDYLSMINTMLQILDPLRFSDSYKFSLVATVMNYVISFELDRYEMNRLNVAMQDESAGGAPSMFKQSLDLLTGSGPNIIKRMHENQIFNELGSAHMFRIGLDAIVRGIEQLAMQE